MIVALLSSLKLKLKLTHSVVVTQEKEWRSIHKGWKIYSWLGKIKWTI